VINKASVHQVWLGLEAALSSAAGTVITKVRTSLSKVGRMSKQFFAFLWRALPTHGWFCLCIALGIFFLYEGWKRVIVISPFQVPSNNSLPFVGEAVADALRDALVRLNEDARRISSEIRIRAALNGEEISPEGPALSRADWEGSRPADPLLLGPSDMFFADLGMTSPPSSSEFVPVETPPRVDVEVKGFSFDSAVAVARRVWGHQETISGDALREGDKFVLLARSDNGRTWETKPEPASEAGLKKAVRDLAFEIQEDLNPTILGTALLKEGQYERAFVAFRDAADRMPGAEQYLNLGLALARQGKQADAIAHFQEALRLKPDYAEARAQLLQAGVGSVETLKR